jgi:hypothetical protein
MMSGQPYKSLIPYCIMKNKNRLLLENVNVEDLSRKSWITKSEKKKIVNEVKSKNVECTNDYKKNM